MMLKARSSQQVRSNFSSFLQDRWEPGLPVLISNIRTKSSDAFDRIGCAGDVELVPDPDYAQWRWISGSSLGIMKNCSC